MGKVVAIILWVFTLNFCKADLGDDITQQVKTSLAGLDNLGARIEHQLAPLNNLGDRIQQQVYAGLKPVRELETRSKVVGGINGVTIASFSPGDRQFIVKDNALWECVGSISTTTGSCSGNMQLFQFTKREDFCYAPINSIVNNWYCLTGNGGTSFSVINGVPQCSSFNGSPSLLISIQDFNKLCKESASSVTYTYFTNSDLSDVGPEINCHHQNGNPRIICTFTESKIKNAYPGLYSRSFGNFNIIN